MPENPVPSTKKELLAFAGVFGCLVIIAALWKLGVFTAAGNAAVNHSISTMKQETERQQNQPKTVVMKDGRRIECKKVSDRNNYWGLILTNGNASAVKKEDVLEIVDGVQTDTTAAADQHLTR